MLPLHPKFIFRFLSIHFDDIIFNTKKGGNYVIFTPTPYGLILFLDNDVIPLGYCDVTFTPTPLTHERMLQKP